MINESYKVKILATARRDLAEIYAYIAYEVGDMRSAEKVYLYLETAIVELETLYNTHKFFAAPGLDLVDVRAFVVGKYRIFYRVAERLQQVRVLRIVHVSRDLRGLDKQSFE